jgi:hypothetical protein
VFSLVGPLIASTTYAQHKHRGWQCIAEYAAAVSLCMQWVCTPARKGQWPSYVLGSCSWIVSPTCWVSCWLLLMLQHTPDSPAHAFLAQSGAVDTPQAPWPTSALCGPFWHSVCPTQCPMLLRPALLSVCAQQTSQTWSPSLVSRCQVWPSAELWPRVDASR